MSEAMRQELNGVRDEVKSLGIKVGSLEEAMHRMAVAFARMTGDMADIKANMATRSDISALNARMDGFSGLLEDSRTRWAVHADVLAQHDKRLGRLERRRS